MRALNLRKEGKQGREYKVLMGLVAYYLKTGKPVGSNTLKEAGFEDLSSATLRNYFASLEEEGYLMQQHSSGGRIPTHKAFRAYAYEMLETMTVTPEDEERLLELRENETREISHYLQRAAELLSGLTNSAIFLSAPRFDNDYIIGIKLVAIDHARCLCVLITDFGAVQTELLHLDRRLNTFAVKRLESYFQWRLTGHNQPEGLEPEEEQLAQRLYNELMVRYIVNYSPFGDDSIYRTGFAKLLSYPEFHDTAVLKEGLTLFENANHLRLLVRECCRVNHLKIWIGEDLAAYSSVVPECAVLAMPYQINQKSVGAVGILGSVRMPYQKLFGILRAFSAIISETLTRSVYKFKMTFKPPMSGSIEDAYLKAKLLTDRSQLMLLEDKGKNRGN